MLVRVWEYDVPEAQRLEFERRYGRAGDWAALFAASPGFVGTDLYQCVDRPGHYLTVDRFADEAAWHGFLARHSDDYARLDDECASLTLAEHEVIAGTAD